MHDQMALYRALGREQLSVAVLGFSIAIGLTWWQAPEPMPSPALALALIPVALLAGLAAGRSSTRSLSFWLARPGRRTLVLRARVRVAAAILAIAWFLTTAPTVLADPRLQTLLVGLFAAAVVAIAFAAALVASAITDREPLAFGIATLVVSAALMVPLLACETLEITLMRVLSAAPGVVLGGAAVCVGACTSAVFRSWRDHLPVRDHRNARAVVVRCAGAWVVTELLWGSATYYAAAPEHGMAAVVLGADARGLLVATGSFDMIDADHAARVDAVMALGEADAVVLDATVRSAASLDAATFELTSAFVAGGTLTLALSSSLRPREWHRLIVMTGLDAPVHVIEASGEVSVSASGRTLVVGGPWHSWTPIDTASGQPRPTRWREEGRRIDWVGDDPLIGTWDGGLAFGDIYIGGIEPGRSYLPSPDQRYVAIQQSDGRWHGLKIDVDAERPTRFDLLDLELLLVRSYAVEMVRPRMIKWSGGEHILVVAKDPDDLGDRLYAIDAFSGMAEELAAVPFGLRVTQIDGPLEGPWLVSRSAQQLQAWAPGGEVLWEEDVAILADDGPNVRRWAQYDGQVVGLGPRGRWWSHPLPWDTGL